MARGLIRNLDPRTVDTLKQRAERNGRSLQAELHAVVERAAASDMVALGTLDIEMYPSADLLPAALELAIGLDQSVYDCIYVALAVARGCELVTADEKLARALARSPFGVNVRSLVQ